MKGKPGKANPANLKRPGGRPKGSTNKYGKTVRDQFLLAFEELGGLKALVKWARSSPVRRLEFYKLLVHILPKTVEASVEHTWNIENLDFGGDSEPEEVSKFCQSYSSRFSEN